MKVAILFSGHSWLVKTPTQTLEYSEEYLREKFTSLKQRAVKNSSTECLECQRNFCDRYPRVKLKNGSNQNQYRISGSRLAWVVEKGEIPEDKQVLHSCDNPSCINIEHLRLGTGVDNMTDRSLRDRVKGHFGDQKIKAKQATEIRELWASCRMTRQELAKKYNVTKQYIGQIILRKYWRFVP